MTRLAERLVLIDPTDIDNPLACFVRNHTRRPIALTVPFGQMEKQEKLTSVQLQQVLAQNRRHYGATGSRVTLPSMSEGESLSRPDLL
jgi:hypothetical protein